MPATNRSGIPAKRRRATKAAYPQVAKLKAAANSKLISGTIAKENLQVASKGGFNFTKTAAAHMDQKGRMIPMQIMDDIIKAPLAVVKDPQGTNAIMHYSQMWKNGKLYNVEVLYYKATNTIMHFQYGRDAMGPLLKIPK